jgi:P-type Mg2+ transporter
MGSAVAGGSSPGDGTSTDLPGRPAGVQGATTVAPAADLTLGEAAALPAGQVLDRLGSTAAGLSAAEAGRRLDRYGPNAVRSHHPRALTILARQFRNAVLILLLVTAVVSFFLGDRTDAAVIGVILLLSVGLGFVNEYRAARTADALHSTIRYTAVVLRDGTPAEVDVTALVPGDVVRLTLGEVVPADLRLLSTTELQTDESVLTGESLPVDKAPDPVPAGSATGDLTDCVFMGTVVHAGTGTGVVVATGPRAEFGRIAVGLGTEQPETEFQAGLAASRCCSSRWRSSSPCCSAWRSRSGSPPS